MTLIDTLLCALISVAPPVETNSNTSTPDNVDYEQSLSAVEDALLELNTRPEQGTAPLEAALIELRDHAPELANDPRALELRTMAELAIARAQLSAGDRFAAAATIDATLEALGEVPLELERLGPNLGQLVEERAHLLAARGHGRLRVECERPCRVLVDERNLGDIQSPGGARELSLPLGTHRVWIEALSTDEAALRSQLELDSADELVLLRFPSGDAELDSPLPAPRLAARELDRNLLELGPTRRLAPRWAEISTLSAGVLALAAGAALWAIDSSCPGGADINDPVACPQLYDTRNAGIALVSAGFAASLTGGVMLVVDETRLGQRRGQELGLVWTTQF